MGKMTWDIILESEDSNWERKTALLGWAAKSSAWEEPNTHFPFVAGCPDNTDSMKVLHFILGGLWHRSIFKHTNFIQQVAPSEHAL